MTVAVIAISVVCLLLVTALVHRETQHSRHVAERERSWDLERGALLTRIQHPEIVHLPRPVEIDGEQLVPGFDEEIKPKDDIDLVGTVVDGGEDG